MKPEADTACRVAIAYVLNRVRDDPEFAYHMLDTQALALCMRAYSLVTETSVEEVRKAVYSSRTTRRSVCEEMIARHRESQAAGGTT